MLIIRLDDAQYPPADVAAFLGAILAIFDTVMDGLFVNSLARAGSFVCTVRLLSLYSVDACELYVQRPKRRLPTVMHKRCSWGRSC